MVTYTNVDFYILHHLTKGTMRKSGRLSMYRCLCLYPIICMTYYIGLPSLLAQSESSPLMVLAFMANKRTLRKQCYYIVGRERRDPFSSRVDSRTDYCISDKNTSYQHRLLMGHRIGVIGGGLAGLSTAYHLLEKSPSTDITIIDTHSPGAGGASAVAGGLLHPLSPKGKLAYRGIEGLVSANKLVQAASKFEDNAVLRHKIYRIAKDEAQAVRFQKTAVELPELATWIEPDYSTIGEGVDKDDWEGQYFSSEKNVTGALRLSGGCKVLHMRSYLKGLWSYCESIGSGTKKWITYNDIDKINCNEWKERLAVYDCVVFAAGSGLFQSSLLNQNDFPITLVRGQSIEMTMKNKIAWNAILCGKYVSPLPESGRVIIGATHEFKNEPLTPDEVKIELKERSYHFASGPWDDGTIDNVTSGDRVQSNRGPYGRLPIIGKLNSSLHHNSWVFTGLSGRGILYHGIYGDLLSNLILGETIQNSDHLEKINWWRK